MVKTHDSDDSGYKDLQVLDISSPVTPQWEMNKPLQDRHYWVNVRMGWAMTLDGQRAPFIRPFRNPMAGTKAGTYVATMDYGMPITSTSQVYRDDLLIKATVSVDAAGKATLVPAVPGRQRWSGTTTVRENEQGLITSKQTLTSDHYLVSEQAAQDLYQRTYEVVDKTNRVDRPKSVLHYRAGQIIQRTDFCYTSQGTILVRQRVTTTDYATDGSPMVATTVYGYYRPNPSNNEYPESYVGKLRFIVRPEGVNQVLKVQGYPNGVKASNPQTPCGLDTTLDDRTLMEYAETVYDEYWIDPGFKNGREKKITRNGTCCGGGNGGVYTFDYGENPSASGLNVWRTYRRTEAPGGLRTVEFYNEASEIVYQVVQNQTGSQIWTTHKSYSTAEDQAKGYLVEERMPSACTGYTPTLDSNGWVVGLAPSATGTAGLVRMYGYHTLCGKVTSESVRMGVSGPATLLRTCDYEQPPGIASTVYNVKHENVYPVAGGDPVTTTHTYTYYSDKAQNPTTTIRQDLITYPAVSGTNNGSGTATTVRRYYTWAGANTPNEPRDDLYYNSWTQREDGTYALTEQGSVGPEFGLVRRTIEDVNPSASGLPMFPTLPGWNASRTGAAHLTTLYEYYGWGNNKASYGKLQAVTDPAGRRSVYAYSSLQQTSSDKLTTTDRVTLMTPHMDGAGKYNYAPVSITVSDLAGHTVASAQGKPTAATDRNLQNDWDKSAAGVKTAFKGTIHGLTINNYDSHRGWLSSTEQYASGIADASKLVTAYSYHDDTGLLDHMTGPDGTVTLTEYETSGRLRPIGTWMGPYDTTHLQKISATEYDNNVIGDGTVTKSQAFAGPSAVYTTTYAYDDRDQLRTTTGADGVRTVRALDNLGRMTGTQTYDAQETLCAQSSSAYDERGQVYQATLWQVDSAGNTGHTLTTKNWYDARGRVMKTRSPNGLCTKTAFDGAGRTMATYLCYWSGTGQEGSDPLSLTNDIVIEQAQYDYDKAGNVLLTTHYQRNDDAGGTLDSLTTAHARRTCTAAWYDVLERQTATANYGTINMTASTLPKTPPLPSDTVIVTKYVYDAGTGRLTDTYDNKNIRTQRSYDDLGRTYQVVENVAAGTVSDRNRTTQYGYDAAGRLATITAVNSATNDQVTRYYYADNDSDNGNDTTVLSRSWVTETAYPDNTQGNSTTDRVKVTYDWLGRKTNLTDQRGVGHLLTYDTAGRFEADTVINLGTTAVDGTVMKIGRAYDNLSRVQEVASYGTGGTVLNRVAFTYDDWGNVKTSVQTHGVAAASQTVGYAYDDGAGAGNDAQYLRLSSVTYPTNRVVKYNYNTSSSTDGHLSRVLAITDSSGTATYAQYTYLGAGTVVEVDHPLVTGGLGLTYKSTTPGSYPGLDQFGHVVDQKWTVGGAAVDEYAYTYDRDSNRISRTNSGHNTFSETYAYDGLNRLTTANRNSHVFQTWSLDPLGNWAAFNQANSAGTWTLNQTRSHNVVNEIASITPANPWVNPTYDDAGNMATGPKPGAENVTQYLKYDAWNRLVEVDEGTPWVQKNRYDGLGRRIQKTTTADTTDYFYNEAWQVLEEDNAAGVYAQYVWDLRYIDAPVLRWRTTPGNNLDETLYYCQDANMNVTSLVSTGGGVVERYSCTPYGSVTFYDSGWQLRAAGSAVDNQILYCGYRFDNETGLDQVRSRMYHPTLGRWAQRDPEPGDRLKRERGSRNGYNDVGETPYLYVRANPEAYLDPEGKTAIDAWNKWWGIPVKKAWSLDAGGLIQFKIGGIPGVQAGASTSIVFFSDTCEVAAFSAATGGGKEFRDDILPAVLRGKEPQYSMPPAHFGKIHESGAQFGVSLTVGVATMQGPPPAGAASFVGDFHTIQGNATVVIEGVPIPFAGSFYWGDKVGGQRWFGGSLGVSPFGLPYGGGLVDWNFVQMGPSLVLPKCVCYAVVYAMPPIPDLP